MVDRPTIIFQMTPNTKVPLRIMLTLFYYVKQFVVLLHLMGHSRQKNDTISSIIFNALSLIVLLLSWSVVQQVIEMVSSGLLIVLLLSSSVLQQVIEMVSSGLLIVLLLSWSVVQQVIEMVSSPGLRSCNQGGSP